MTKYTSIRAARVASLALLLAGTLGAAVKSNSPPAVGDAAPAFKLNSVAGDVVELAALENEGPVVLVVLRGYPGYQCPLCSLQVGELLRSAEMFKTAGARVLLVYPGPADELAARAKEFIGTKNIPAHFTFLLDPDYVFTSAYHLRWDAPKETAYPSTFVIDSQGMVRFAQVSKTHGGRAKTAEVLKALESL